MFQRTVAARKRQGVGKISGYRNIAGDGGNVLPLTRRALLGAFGLLAMPVPISAWAAARGASWPKVRALMAGLAPGRLPGLAAAIGPGTDDAEFISIGTIARDSKTAIDPDTLWRVYSMTKPITGMAAMLLVEDGRLTLDQNIADFLPAFANPRVLLDPEKDLRSRAAKAPITVRHLLTHTSGLGYSFMLSGPLLGEYLRLGLVPLRAARSDDPFTAGAAPTPDLASFADRLAELPLLADPGTRWIYSVGLDLLGRVIEVASGKPFDRFVSQRIFDPLGMRSTFWQVPARETQRLVTNHVVDQGKLKAIDTGAATIYLDPPGFPFGGAGLVMSARDYDRFLAMLMGGGALAGVRVMKPETAALGMSNLLPPGIDTAGTFADGQGFGAGGRVIVKPVRGGPGVGSFGWEGIAATIGWVDPVRRVRACGFAQYLPDPSLAFPDDFAKAIYDDIC